MTSGGMGFLSAPIVILVLITQLMCFWLFYYTVKYSPLVQRLSSLWTGTLRPRTSPAARQYLPRMERPVLVLPEPFLSVMVVN